MRMLAAVIGLSAALFASVELPSQELFLEELPEVIERLLQHHEGKREIDGELLVDSHKRFLERVDPQKVYLLEHEVNPFVDRLREKEFLRLFERCPFAIYEQMAQVCKKAVYRARSARAQVHPVDNRLTVRHSYYASSEEELLSRMRVWYLSQVCERVSGETFSDGRWERACEIVEDEIRADEQSILELSQRGSGQKALAQAILESVVASFDVHSKVMDGQQARKMRENLTKRSCGTGIEVGFDNGSCFIEKIVEGSPADTMGSLHVHDRIIAINGVSPEKMTRGNIESLLYGKEGEKVALELEGRSSGRRRLDVPCAEYTLLEGRVRGSKQRTKYGPIAVVELPGLYRAEKGGSSHEDLQRILEQGPFAGIVLDLRKNLGGYITEAVDVVGLFIKTGVVVSAVYAGKEKAIFRDLDALCLHTGPVVVLISSRTASAAEIIAQALSDYGRAIIVGDVRSFGKGSVQAQTVTERPGALPFKMTVGRFHSVSGISPQGKGIYADIVLAPSPFAVLENASSYEDIAPLFVDRLEDIEGNERKWYSSYYLPFLQHPTDKYRKHIRALREKRARRLVPNEQDPQLAEAVEILQDLLELVSR